MKMIYKCPKCGLPVGLGRKCPGGCKVEAYFSLPDIDTILWKFGNNVCIHRKEGGYIIEGDGKKQLRSRELGINTVMQTGEEVRVGLFELMAAYVYGTEDISSVYRKYISVREKMKKRRTVVMLTRNEEKLVKLIAKRYSEYSLSALVDVFALSKNNETQ